ncbi:GNAT family N-acetyltransferase [Rhizobium sp. Root483D2]|uniref:GNAT family N-acetyltransferase n=1 Tax=Rhizobium sp. Root483D2 TaxID=1736545 RepID=UPI000712841A|nr:GNAT family N-acetyltransferase [Rhizobium sp. Root483D2]KQY31874.1 GNAT family acetyltransferase [Rhizobium sp. Root483D2]
MSHKLDRPIWSALETHHAALAQGGPLARRYPPSVSLFAATGNDRPESLEALCSLAAPGETLLVVQSSEILVPGGMTALSRAPLVQMILAEPLPEVADPRIERLCEDDAQAMLDLATLTKPGPFTLRAQSLGSFWGIKQDGRLVAMAGERLRQPGYVELSGVCTHPDVRGQGLGRLMSLYVAGVESARGQRVYLHSYATNTAAISLYASIGFKLRSEMQVAALALAV